MSTRQADSRRRESRFLVIALILIIYFIISVPGCILTTNTAANISWLHTDNKYIKDVDDNIVLLRGVSLIDLGIVDDDQWGKRGGKKVVDLIKMATNSDTGWYANVIRLPVFPEQVDGNREPGWNQCWGAELTSNSYFDDHLDAAVQECINQNVYCIIDWQHIADYQDKSQETINFWRFIAGKYKDVPNVIFEIFNEPIYPDNWDIWRDTAQMWVNEIRQIAPENLIIVGGPLWSRNLSGAAENPVTSKNIVYSAHFILFMVESIYGKKVSVMHQAMCLFYILNGDFNMMEILTLPVRSLHSEKPIKNIWS